MKNHSRYLVLIIGGVVGVTGLQAQAEVLADNEVMLCLDISGKKEYKNGIEVNGLSESARQRCKKIYVPGVSILPGPDDGSTGTVKGDRSSRWTRVSHSTTFAVFLDKESIVTTPKLRKAWLLTTYDPDTAATQGYQSAKSLWLYRCQERQSAIIQDILYRDKFGSGDVVRIGAQIGQDQARFEDVVPGSVGESQLNAVCKTKK